MKPILLLQIPYGLTVRYDEDEIRKDYDLIVVLGSKEFHVKILSKPGDYAQ